jgi:prepilin peptidase CpaA
VIAEILVLAALPILLVIAAGWDVASFTIPNFIQAALLLTFLIFAFASGMSASAFGTHVLAGFIGLVVGFTLFALGYIGGGDAKLFACVSLWLGLSQLLAFVLIASVFGGGLTLGLLSFRGLPLPAPLARQNWVARLHNPSEGVPYGVALAAGALAIVLYTDGLRSAALG